MRTGVVTDVRATIGSKSETVRLVLRLQRAELALPLQELRTSAGPIQVPDLVKRETALTLDVKAGAPTRVLLPGAGWIKPLVLTVKADPTTLEEEPGNTDEELVGHALGDLGRVLLGEVSVALDHGQGAMAEEGGDLGQCRAAHGEIGGRGMAERKSSSLASARVWFQAFRGKTGG